ncbi:helix-turn-helix domain-containing protein [Parapedobacter pyrenivorans]|uniref:helix-turn-helix domain-containing protein n=1 Tax=Parapedobacter pyrenivorans TaxID=1305674 RepID=UPI0027D9520C|nr:AraC family transcriptional regulator [Parapedobacter pyrenivorans]
MRYHSIPPGKKLSDFIRYFWVLESESPYTHHSMADVCPELLFHYRGRFDEIFEGGITEKSFISGIQGQCCQTRKFQINRSFGIFGVYFYPHAIPLVFDVPTVEFTGEMVSLDTWSRNWGSMLESRVMEAANNAERIKILSDFVVGRLARHHSPKRPVFQAINDIIHCQPKTNVKQLAANYCLSERQFERQFQQFAGMPPKLFCRITRFHWAMSYYGGRKIKLTDIAAECGYYDQSHFIHDFKHFSGCHPRQFFTGDTDATSWRD